MNLYLLHINIRSLFVLAVLSLLFASSTSCITANHCKNINTYQQGYSDALSGKTVQSFYQKVRLCAKHEVVLNLKAYNKGWMIGLKKLCTYKRGHYFGSTGAKYQNICTQNNLAKFIKGYEEGLKSFCTYKKGYYFGSTGANYQNTCPKKLETNFLKGYTLGVTEFTREEARRAREEAEEAREEAEEAREEAEEAREEAREEAEEAREEAREEAEEAREEAREEAEEAREEAERQRLFGL